MRRRILFVDDEQRVLDALRRMLRAHRTVWDLVCIDDPKAAWERLQSEDFDALVSDVRMPGMSGLELLEQMKGSERLKNLPVVILTGLESRDLKRLALDLGAADLLNKPVDPEDLVARLRSVLKLKAYEDQLRENSRLLEKKVRERTAELERSRLDVVWRLGKAAEHRDNETGRHVIRVGCMSRILAEALGMDRDFVQTLFVAAPLHDIGKIGIPDSILAKPGPLNEEEWAVMKRHCRIGARILQGDAIAALAFKQWRCGAAGVSGSSDNPILQMAASIALAHHEKWDGTGYPQELAGERIPLAARIVAISDVFDALTSHRPYKEAYSEPEALRILEDLAGRHFDPRVYTAFQETLPEILSVRKRFGDPADAPSALEEASHEADLVCG